MSLSRLCSRITFFTKQSPSLSSPERNSRAAGSSGVTSAQSPRALLSLRSLVSPVSFTQKDQRLRAAWSLSVHLKRMSSSRRLSQMTPCPWQHLMQKSGGSGGETKVLPPSETPRPKPDAKLILPVEDQGLEWSAPEKPAHGLLDKWYLPGSHQQSSRQRPTPFLPAVHDELTKM